jgi:cardiolipin synthase A/B
MMNIIQGNRITLLKNGEQYFPELEMAIDAAIKDIRIETYIFEDDQSGNRIANALKRAASRGVSVRLLVDGFGTGKTSAVFFDVMREAGVIVSVYRPARGWFDLSRRRVRRVHRKIALIDGHVGFVGGINFIDDFNKNFSDTHPRYDYAVKIEGPILADIYDSVTRLWRIVKLFDVKQRVRERGAAVPVVSPVAVGEAALAFLTRDNVSHRRDIEREYRHAIVTAKAEIIIVNSYFLPGRRLRNSLMRAARRGVAVTVLLQGRADHPLLQLATRSMYDKLLAAGIQIYEYHTAMLHGKVAVIDREWATVGSSNLDPFSLLLNREANIVSLDKSFAETLRASILEEISQHATQLNFASWQQRSVWQRVQSWFALLVARVMSGLVGVKTD